MMIQFSEKDAQTCFACSVQKPEFRLVSLERVPRKDGILIPTSAATLLCRRCLITAFGELHQSFTQYRFPLGHDETENHSLVRQVGLLVTPISMTLEERQVLLEELGDGDQQIVETRSARRSRTNGGSLP
jgi:hypothetical protein